MQGLGNDFVVVDNFNGRINLSVEQVVFLCDRKKGVGADGVILVEKSEGADAFMNYYNSDGSLAEMCGNGVRCVAKFLKDEYLKNKTEFKINTRAGMKEIKYHDDDTFAVNMGKPVFNHTDFPENSLELEGLNLDFASMGNPHAVAFVDDLNNYNLSLVGPLIENNSNFPNKINFHIVEEKSKNNFLMKTWERGCGITLACGTGACAVYALARKNKNADPEITTELPGGKLSFSENEKGDIIMRGSAVSVFSGLVYVE